MGTPNRRWVIADRPLGRALADSDFRLERTELAAPAPLEALVRTLYLAFDPAQKGFMENVANYAAATSLGALMPGTGVAQVIESRSELFVPGQLVRGPLGWQEYATVAASALEPVPADLSPTAALAAAGMTGRTAYFGLLHVGRAQAGDTVVISGAAGAVGSVAGQIAKIAGCRVIGIAGGPAKCAMLVDELRFDGAIDYKSEKVRSRLRELCPQGIDVFFDNVGGEILNDCLARLAFGARVAICGGIARYNADPRKPEQLPPGPQNYFNVVMMRASIAGFLVHHFAEYYAQADQRLAAWVRSGQIHSAEDVLEGFENAPRALMRLFEGVNRGKQLLHVADADVSALEAGNQGAKR